MHKLYDLLALRPLNERALELCCHSLNCDIISLDLSARLPFILRFKTLGSALQRGVYFEICYSTGLISGGSEARRNLISGATALIRATRGRGIIVSSEARSALGVRGPWDVINLATVWGLSQEKGKDAVCEGSRKLLALARMRRESYRGVIELVHGNADEGLSTSQSKDSTESNGLKRKSSTSLEETEHGSEASRERPGTARLAKNRAKKTKVKA